eukprot:CAMPEP_0119047960 /NCGR_PEP_ID=MMETSP1177-20130426/56021_1 /TAXON_ID=2985 /ORGANISM="Ochromonas sp, Strain CCMP1899" /LENGTH=864 /DNA_ID=CAMNT_0007023211 /DNA_START=1185 /DNA_END=3779 /DNA_ORIENTATION=+
MALEKSKVMTLETDIGNMAEDGVDLSDVLDVESALSVLHNMITCYAHEGVRGMDKENRNEILAILSLIAESLSSHKYFIESGLLSDLIFYSCYAESPADNSWLLTHKQALANPRNFATIFELDLQFKRMLWLLISDLLKNNDNPDSLLIVAPSPLLSSIVSYLEFDTLENNPENNNYPLEMYSPENQSPNQNALENFINQSPSISTDGGDKFGDFNSVQTSNVSNISYGLNPPSITDEQSNSSTYGGQYVPTNTSTIALKNSTGSKGDKSYLEGIPRLQMLELQVSGATLLGNITPKLLEEFLSIEGPSRIYRIAVYFCYSEVPEHKELVGMSLILLARLLTTSDVVRGMMEEQNSVELFIFLFDQSTEISIKAQAARAISILCDQNEACQEQLRLQDGISLLIHAIQSNVTLKRPLVGLRAGVKIIETNEGKYFMNRDDPLLQPLAGDISVLIVAILDCVSKAIVGNESSEARFAQEDGLEVLLELLETSPCVLRFQVIRLLSDILENSDMVSFVCAWRSPKTMRSAAQLATHCWLDEEVRLDGVRVDGVIGNIMDPLGNHIWPDQQTQIPVGYENMSSASSVITDGSASFAVSRLSAAILHSRFNTNIPQGGVVLSMRNLVLEKDMRGVVASVLQLLGAFDTKDISDMDADTVSSPIDIGVRSSSNDLSMIGQTTDTAARIGPGSPTAMDESSYSSIPMGGGSVPIAPFTSGKQSNSASVGSLRSPPFQYPEVSVIEDDKEEEENAFSVVERQVIAIARRYAVLREGGWWHEISEGLHKESLQPIEADFTMVQAHLDMFFNASQAVQMEQMMLQELNEISLKTTEKTFINKILSKKTQEAKTALLKHQTKTTGRITPYTKKT